MSDASHLVQVLFAPTLWFLDKNLFKLVCFVFVHNEVVWLGNEFLACATATHRKMH